MLSGWVKSEDDVDEVVRLVEVRIVDDDSGLRYRNGEGVDLHWRPVSHAGLVPCGHGGESVPLKLSATVKRLALHLLLRIALPCYGQSGSRGRLYSRASVRRICFGPGLGIPEILGQLARRRRQDVRCAHHVQTLVGSFIRNGQVSHLQGI